MYQKLTIDSSTESKITPDHTFLKNSILETLFYFGLSRNLDNLGTYEQHYVYTPIITYKPKFKKYNFQFSYKRILKLKFQFLVFFSFQFLCVAPVNTTQ